jgi:hypothetical protein
MTVRLVKDYIGALEAAKTAFCLASSAFPDARTHYSSSGDFLAKSVNQQYTKWEFYRHDSGVWVSPYCEINFTFNDKTEVIKVYSSPRQNRLVYLTYPWRRDEPRTIKFSRLSLNLKNNHFKDDMLNACRIEIMEFVKKNAKYPMDSKHLEPRLKKLLAFT